VPCNQCGQPPNGSRLSCGANAGGRKRPALRYELVGARTYASSQRRPRQLQALVRRRGHFAGSEPAYFAATCTHLPSFASVLRPACSTRSHPFIVAQ